MSLGFDVVEQVLKLPVFIDHKSRSNGAHVGFAIHALFTVGTILLLNLVVWIAQELEIEFFLVLEFLELGWLIGRDP